MSIKSFLSRLIIGIITIGGIASTSYADSTTTTPATLLYNQQYKVIFTSFLEKKAIKKNGKWGCADASYDFCHDTTGRYCAKTTYICNDGGTPTVTDQCSSTAICNKPVYSCPSGYSLSGSTCLKIGSTTSPTTTPATANVQYAYSWYFLKYKTCPLGGYVQIAPCTKKKCDYSKPVCSKTTYSCPSGYTLQPDKQCKLN